MPVIEMASVGGVMADVATPDVGYLVTYKLTYGVPRCCLCVTFDKHIVVHSSFQEPIRSAASWVHSKATTPAREIQVSVARCDEEYPGDVEDASAQLAIAFLMRGVAREMWYLPLIERIVMTGVLCDPITGDVKPHVGYLETKVRTFRDKRYAWGFRWLLMVVPDNGEDDFEARVVRARSLDQLERALVSVWARAALERISQPWTILEYLIGNTWFAITVSVLLPIFWLWLPIESLAVAAAACYGVSVLVLFRILKKERTRLDDEERKLHRHRCREFDDPFPPNAKCPAGGWLKMLRSVADMVRSPLARRLCEWAAIRVERTQLALDSHPFASAPWRAWRFSFLHWVPLLLIVASFSFWWVCPLRHAVVEAVVPFPTSPASIDAAIYYDGSNARIGVPVRRDGGEFVVGKTGWLYVRATQKGRSGRRIRVACSGPTGSESTSAVPGSAVPTVTCKVDGIDNSIVRDVSDDDLRIPYTVFLPSNHREFSIGIEEVTHFNRPLTSRRIQLYWDSELDKPADGGGTPVNKGANQ
jgi:hypothetical protein